MFTKTKNIIILLAMAAVAATLSAFIAKIAIADWGEPGVDPPFNTTFSNIIYLRYNGLQTIQGEGAKLMINGGTDSGELQLDSDGVNYFFKSYGCGGGSLYPSYGKAIAQTSDGGYIITGATACYGAGNYDVWLAKFDRFGNQAWARTAGGLSGDWGNAVIEDSDGNYVVAGRSSGDMCLLKFASSGGLLSSKLISKTSFDEGKSIIQASGYLLAGSMHFNDTAADLALVKLDSSFNNEWAKRIGTNNHEYIESVIQTSDGGYLAVGASAIISPPTPDLFLIKLSSSGGIEWSAALGGGNFDEWGKSVIEDASGNYLAVGYTTRNEAGLVKHLMLAKFNSNGVFEWAKTIGDQHDSYGESIITANDGGYVVAGHGKSYYSGSNKLWLIKFNSSGSVEWFKIISHGLDAKAYSLTQASDGGYAVTGQKTESGAVDYQLVAKFDDSGNLQGCSGITVYSFINDRDSGNDDFNPIDPLITFREYPDLTFLPPMTEDLDIKYYSGDFTVFIQDLSPDFSDWAPTLYEHPDSDPGIDDFIPEPTLITHCEDLDSRLHWSVYSHFATGDFNIWNNSNLFTINESTGNVGIGDETPEEKLTINGNLKSGAGATLIAPSITGPSASLGSLTVSGSANIKNNLNIGGDLTVDRHAAILGDMSVGGDTYIAGPVGVGYRDIMYDFEVDGTVEVTGSKLFKINHPTKPDYYLAHSVVEGPEAAVYYRGQGRLENGKAEINLPGYFEALTRAEGRTIMLTAKGDEPYRLSYGLIVDGKFNVYGEKEDGEFYWEVKAVRADVPELEAEQAWKQK